MEETIVWPPVEPVRAAAAKLGIQSEGAMSTLIYIGAGIMRWAFVKPTRTGAMWVHSVFGIEESVPHRFFKYFVNDMPITNFVVLYRSYCDPGIDPDAIKEIEACMKRQNLIGPEEHLDKMDVKALLQEFSLYIHEDPVIYDGKTVTKIYRTIGVTESSRAEAVARIVRTTGVRYEPFEFIDVVQTYTYVCQECGKSRPCVQSTSTPICKRCLAKVNPSEDTADCEHVECTAYGCSSALAPQWEEEDEEEFDLGYVQVPDDTLLQR